MSPSGRLFTRLLEMARTKAVKSLPDGASQRLRLAKCGLNEVKEADVLPTASTNTG